VPIITTSIKLGSIYKKVVDPSYGPAQLRNLEDRIDSVANSDRWVKCPSGQQVASIDSGGCMSITG